MEILHTETINTFKDMMMYSILLTIVAVVLGVTFYIGSKKLWVGLLVCSSILLLTWTAFKYSVDEYEKLYVKVTDWNVINESEYEILEQKGKFVVLRKNLKE